MKNLFRLSSTFIVFLLAFMFSTEVFSQGKPKGMVKIKAGPPEDFSVFYTRFHSDSIFQMSRLREPLLGMKKIQGQEIPWTINNWDLMITKVQDMDLSIYRTRVKNKKKYFEQEVWTENKNYFSAHRFELHGSKWYLVFAYQESF